jgi:pyruvate dehydrogenase E2 component (dihydrolipoamide acetyltransferase)
LHGFAGERETWLALQVALEYRRRTIAFDLPGHGAARDWPQVGHAGVAAKAVVASLDALGVERFHLIGHSMGGAVATIIAHRFAETERVRSLTLLAPGGFGPEINHRLLRRFASATEAHEIQSLLEQFFGFERPVPRAMADRMALARRDPGVIERLMVVCEAILDGERQKAFDLAAMAQLPHPIRLVWGRQDRVLPVHQAAGVPGVVAVHLFDGVGHMPHLEIPREIARLAVEATAAG